MFHEFKHGLTESLGLAEVGMLFKGVEESCCEFCCGVAFDRPVRDQKGPSAGIEERLGKARETLGPGFVCSRGVAGT